MTTKEEAVRVISQLPDDATMTDIVDELCVRISIEEGIKQLDRGQGIEHADVKERMKKWLA